jgi:hypothetical protein
MRAMPKLNRLGRKRDFHYSTPGPAWPVRRFIR